MDDEPRLFCTFEAAGRLFGVPLFDIKEVTAETHCTRIPHAPKSVKGYVNIRGQIILALDLKRILNLPSDDQEAKRLVIFKAMIGPAFGLLVDEVGEIASVRKQDIAADETSLSPESHGPSGLIRYICRLQDRLLVVLEAKNFLPIVEQELHQPSL